MSNNIFKSTYVDDQKKVLKTGPNSYLVGEEKMISEKDMNRIKKDYQKGNQKNNQRIKLTPLSPNQIQIDFVSELKDNAPLVSQEDVLLIKELYTNNPFLCNDKDEIDRSHDSLTNFTTGSERFHNEEPWIQTFSGRRFNPTNPIPNAIVIQDIAHSLAFQCRFTGHVKEFYSVAQHSVLVSYLCDTDDALWGLLHDASEAYLTDIPSPLKRSGHFDNYIVMEQVMQNAICKRFGLKMEEPPSVKNADRALLATEARDLMSPVRKDWDYPYKPLPFKIESLSPKEAEALFLKRFVELIENPKYNEFRTNTTNPG